MNSDGANKYDHKAIESKWQNEWEEKQVYKTQDSSSKPKKFVLDMFPYPSGEGLHVGHPRGYIATDVYSRKARMEGFNVLHPMGWDAFGLPAENFAIKNKVHPSVAVSQNVARFKKQLSIIGLDYDWNREINTTDPEFYKWTQWVFLQMLNKGLAYESNEPVNWCPTDKTVLANEDVEPDGTCERCGTKVEKRPLRQWVLKITDYADRLLADLDKLPKWPEGVKEAQRNWIGRNEGSEIDFKIIPKIDFTPNQKTKNILNLKEKIDSYISEKNIKAVYSGGLALAIHIGEVYRDHDDIDLCPLGEDSFDALCGFFKMEGFSVSSYEDKDKRYFLKFTKGDIAVDLIQIGIDEKGIYDLEKSRPDYWNIPESEILNNEICSYFSPTTIIRLKFSDREKDIFDKNIVKEYLDKKITVFTTRADTLFGVSFLGISAGLAKKWLEMGWKPSKEVEEYITNTLAEEIVRDFKEKEKTGIYAGFEAINPASKEKVPVWITNYVMNDVGTGAIMGVPAHDERDFEFAKKYSLPIKEVVIQVAIPKGERNVAKSNKGALAVITRKEDSKILLQYENKWNQWRLPGGSIDESETPEQGLIREVLEETGYKAAIIRPLGSTYVCYEKFTDNKNWYERRAFGFVVEIDQLFKNELKLTKEESEAGLKYEWIDPKKAIELMKSNVSPMGEAELVERHLNNEYVFSNNGILVDSNQFSGLTSEEAKTKITEFVGGKLTSTYRIKDWVFSRQRYWGEPIPVIRCDSCGVVGVPESELPVVLPNVESYEPTGTGESPLANIDEWVNTTCPKCGGSAKRETNTMPQWAGSSWYYLRYIDPKNKLSLVDKAKEKEWMPVDVYVGGDHATRHLIYARFWHKFLYDIGVVSTEEPFPRLEFLGFIVGPDGKKFSKRLKNGISPDDVIYQFGSDAFRLYEAFIGPFEGVVPWNNDGMVGTYRFVEKVWSLSQKLSSETKPEILSLLHKTIKKVDEDIENFKFNTAVSALMIFVNEATKEGISKQDYKTLLQLLAPFAPHITEELWHQMGETQSIHLSAWPKYDETLTLDDEVTVGVQINGKLRAEITLAKDTDSKEIEKMVLELPKIKEYTEGKSINKIIVVPNRIINIVISS